MRGLVLPQLRWLKADLAGVDRSLTPWVILMGHKPWYMGQTNYTYFDELAYVYGVDLIFAVRTTSLFAATTHYS